MLRQCIWTTVTATATTMQW
ncbi:MAG: hypothetical protein EA392_03310 [Cryomorphaceae bacterium]|nr:MAG: hypothetical protein EA392_03310 [Cryomorphaceae bacterium]